MAQRLLMLSPATVPMAETNVALSASSTPSVKICSVLICRYLLMVTYLRS